MHENKIVVNEFNFINQLNYVIKEALAAGGDAGGPYGSSSQSLEVFLNMILEKYNLADRYELKEQKVDTIHMRIRAIQIVKKDERGNEDGRII